MKRQRKWVVGTVLILIAAPFAWAAWIMLSAEQRFLARDAAGGVGSEFMNALMAHKYEDAHALLTTAQQRALSVSAIQKAEEQAEEKYGEPTRRYAIDEYAVNKGLKSARFLFDNTYQNKKGLFLVSLVCTAGKWQVTKYQYDYNPA
jgi:hypothetical protein